MPLGQILLLHLMNIVTSILFCSNPFGRGLLPGKVARSDLISPITNRGLADLVYHKRLPLPPEKEQLPFFQPDYIDCIQATTVVW